MKWVRKVENCVRTKLDGSNFEIRYCNTYYLWFLDYYKMIKTKATQHNIFQSINHTNREVKEQVNKKTSIKV